MPYPTRFTLPEDARALVSIRGLGTALGAAAAILGSVVATIWASVYVATVLDIDRDAVFAIVLGALLSALTLAKPSWFWYHPKAVFLRETIGDRPTTALYLVMAFTFIGLGGLRIARIAQARVECSALIKATTDSHLRLRLLRATPTRAIPGLAKTDQQYTCGSFYESGR
jgi:hypothetical protein